MESQTTEITQLNFRSGSEIGLLLVIIFVPVMALLSSVLFSAAGVLVDPSNNAGMYIFLITVFLLPANFLFMWLFLRFGLVLPATAIGVDMGIAESFRKTSGYGWQLFVTAVLLMLFYSVPGLLMIPFNGIPDIYDSSTTLQLEGVNWYGQLIQLIFNWITMFVSVGILTVLYGHLCEDRPI